MEQRNPAFNIDLTLTNNCNFRCSYCFEDDFFNAKMFNKTGLFIRRMEEFIDSLYFKRNYSILNIGFWGGEPLLNKNVVFQIINHFKDNNKVTFFIYSNGSLIDPFMNLLEEHSQVRVLGRPKIITQISFDGEPIHDICRKTKDNKLTSDLIKNNIRQLWKKKIPSSIKSTVILEAFKYLPDARKDMLRLRAEFPDAPDFYRNQNYFPTIEYYNVEQYSEEEVQHYLKHLENSLIKIAQSELRYFAKNKRFFFSWFQNKKAFCSAGRDLLSIGVEGNIYKCHGAMYENAPNEHLMTNLEDDDFIDIIIRSNKLHSMDFHFEPKECKNCIATYCLRCNAIKFKHSKEKGYINKWRDYTNQPNLCKFYHLNGKIFRAINKIKGK